VCRAGPAPARAAREGRCHVMVDYYHEVSCPTKCLPCRQGSSARPAHSSRPRPRQRVIRAGRWSRWRECWRHARGMETRLPAQAPPARLRIASAGRRRPVNAAAPARGAGEVRPSSLPAAATGGLPAPPAPCAPPQPTPPTTVLIHTVPCSACWCPEIYRWVSEGSVAVCLADAACCPSSLPILIESSFSQQPPSLPTPPCS